MIFGQKGIGSFFNFKLKRINHRKRFKNVNTKVIKVFFIRIGTGLMKIYRE